MELTQEMYDNLAKKFDFCAKKSDLKDFAKKSDLKDFARKSDLKDFARKSDLKDFAKKSDLIKMGKRLEKKFDKKFAKQETVDKITVRLINLEHEVKEIRRDMMTKDDKNEIMSAIDSLTKIVKDGQAELAANRAAHDRMQADINEVRTHTGLKIKHPILNSK